MIKGHRPYARKSITSQEDTPCDVVYIFRSPAYNEDPSLSDEVCKPGSLPSHPLPVTGTVSAHQGDYVPRWTPNPYDEVCSPWRLRTKVDPNPWDEVCTPRRLRTKVDPNPRDEVCTPSHFWPPSRFRVRRPSRFWPPRTFRVRPLSRLDP